MYSPGGPGGGLRRSFKDGDAQVPAYLDDYAFFIAGLLDLFAVTTEPRYLRAAMELDAALQEHFADPAGGFFLSGAAHDQLLAREKPAGDGAVPSGNSVAALSLLRLYELTAHPAYLQRAQALFSGLSGGFLADPARHAELLLAVDFWTDAAKTIVLVAPNARAEARDLIAVWARRFVPNAALVVTTEADAGGALAQIVPVIGKKIAQRGQTTAYVCEAQHCELPARDPALFGKQISDVAPLP
jgi:hypothetical protein